MVDTLFVAAILGDVNAVAAQFSGGNGELLQRNGKGETLMHVAAKHGHTQLLKNLALLKNPMAPSPCAAADLHGRTPLHLAALYGKAHAVVELLKLPDVDPHCKDHNMQTPLLLAALHGHLPVIRQLLKEPKHLPHLQLTAIDRHGHTALHLAVRRADVDTVRFLMERFEAKQAIDQLTCKDQLGWTAVHAAAGVGSVEVIEEFCKVRWDLDAHEQLNRARWSPLHVASWFGHTEIVKRMCGKMGFCVNMTANSLDRLTPLHMAAHNGHEALVEYLLSHDELQVGGCGDALGRIALHYAARQGHTSVVRRLLKSSRPRASGSSSSVNARDVNGLTALHLAAREGHEDVVRILVEDGADVNAKSESSIISKSLLDHVLSSGSLHESLIDPIILEADCWCISQMTPLHLAARNGHMAVVRQLLERPELNIEAVDGHGLTPQDWAEVGKARKGFMVCLVQASRLAGNRTLAKAPKKKLQTLREEMMKWEKRVAVMLPSTFFSNQTMRSMTEACEDLDEVGEAAGQDGKASVKLDEKEDTRATNALRKSDSEDMDTTARMLKEICEIAAQDELSGNTPLHVAVKRGHQKAVETLVKWPMDDINGENSDGHTPLALAFEKNDVEICKLILQNSEKVEDDLCEMLRKAMARNWLNMGILLLGDPRISTSGVGGSGELLDEATHSAEKKFVDLMLRRTTVKERLLQERKEHLDSAGAMLVIAVFIASITYQGALQPPQGKHHWACVAFDWLNGMAFYSAVAATIAVASGSLPVRHMYELIHARKPMRISRGISCVLLTVSSACVVWAYAATGFSRAWNGKVFTFGNGAGAMATTLFLFWFLKQYIQLYKPFCRSAHGGVSEQNNEGSFDSLRKGVGLRTAQILHRMFPRGRDNNNLEDNLLSRNAEMSTAVAV